MNTEKTSWLLSLFKYVLIISIAVILACFASVRIMNLTGLQNSASSWSELSNRIYSIEQDMDSLTASNPTDASTRSDNSPLSGKKIVYDGDSIAESRKNNGGGYAALIAEKTDSTFVNFAKGGARLCSNENRHSVVDNLANLPTDGDLYCFEGGINDFWTNAPIGECDPRDFSGALDTTTICGAMETIFRYCQEHFPGKPVCFVIVHKVQKTATSQNGNGDTFTDYRNAMISVCEKYAIPYYDAFNESGLVGWNNTQSELFLNANVDGIGDGIHPNAEGYKRYYVPQLIDLFEKIIPVH